MQSRRFPALQHQRAPVWTAAELQTAATSLIEAELVKQMFEQATGMKMACIKVLESDMRFDNVKVQI